jgi:D-3-phosphoglycerate dehydrogenase
MSQHIAFLTPMAEPTREVVRALLPDGFTIAFAQTNDEAEHRKLVPEASVIMAVGTYVTAELIALAPKLKLIQKWGIGVDKIDLNAARRAGVTVAITAGATSIPVSEHALMLMLATSRRLPLAHRSLQEGKWIATELRTQCSMLDGKTVGLFGFGNIARFVAKRLTGLMSRSFITAGDGWRWKSKRNSVLSTLTLTHFWDKAICSAFTHHSPPKHDSSSIGTPSLK